MTKSIIILLSILIFITIVYCNIDPDEGINDDKIVPKILVQTVSDKSRIPNKVFQNIKKYASDFKHVIFDDNECVDFIKSNYKREVLETFHRLKNGAHKADLFRYCYLYLNGGLYVDIKTEFIKPLSSVFHRQNLTLVLGSDITPGEKLIYNGVIYTNPKHPIFLELINHMVEISKYQSYDYLIFCRHFYKLLKSYNDYHLFYEKCSSSDSSKCYDGFDKYHYCCNIFDNDDIVIKTRYSDYPW